MKRFYSIFCALILLSALGSCMKEEEETIDLDNMVQEEEDILEQTPGADLLYTPQEVVIKETAESQITETQR